MKAKIYINRYRLKEGKNPIAVRTSKGISYYREIDLKASVVKYNPTKCPRVWIEAEVY